MAAIRLGLGKAYRRGTKPKSYINGPVAGTTVMSLQTEPQTMNHKESPPLNDKKKKKKIRALLHKTSLTLSCH